LIAGKRADQNSKQRKLGSGVNSMNKIKSFATALLASLPFLATACGGGNSDGGSQEAQQPIPSVTPAQTSEPGYVPPRLEGNPAEQKVGQPFRYEIQEEGQPPAEVTVTVQAPQEAGTITLEVSDAYGEDRTLTAPDGQTHMYFLIDVENTGKVPTRFEPDGVLEAASGETYNQDDDATGEVGFARVNKSARVAFPGVNTIELNPHEKAQTAIVFLVPAGTKPNRLIMSEEGGAPLDYLGNAIDARVTI